MPWNIKRSTLFAEATRILRNTSTSLPWPEKAEMMTDLARRMKLSGYPHRVRAIIITEAVSSFCRRVARGDTVNKPRTHLENERWRKKKLDKINWYRKIPNRLRTLETGMYRDEFDSVLFVPATPGSALKKILEDVEMQNNQGRKWRIRMCEQPGRSIISMLITTAHESPEPCGASSCLYCSGYEESDGPKHSCRRPGACYEIICKTCEEEKGIKTNYDGETGRTLALRSQEHSRELDKKSKSSVIYQHSVEAHQGQDIRVKMLPTYFTNKPLERQVREGINISWSSSNGQIMNRRSEWRQPAVPRANFSRDY